MQNKTGGDDGVPLSRKVMLRRITAARRVLWFIDFDGTLVPIRRRPDLAALDEEGRDILARLAAEEKMTVAVISGRPLAFVRQQVNMSKITCAGNHGLEMHGPALKFRHGGAAAARPSLLRIMKKWQGIVPDFSGSLVEDKGMTVTFHYRQVASGRQEEARRRALAAAEPQAGAGRIRMAGGKKLVEARPPVTWGKGEALRHLLRSWDYREGRDLAVALGDDETDRGMFAAVRDGGLAVFVGSGGAPPEANARLAGPAAVRLFLQRARHGRRG